MSYNCTNVNYPVSDGFYVGFENTAYPQYNGQYVSFDNYANVCPNATLNIAGNQTCGQLAQCFTAKRSNHTVLDGQSEYVAICCRRPTLYGSAFTIIIYILITPIIGFGILGALGGGVVKRPFLEATLNFNAAYAGAITSAIMFASAFVNLILLLFQKHPEAPERPVINFQIAVIYCLAIPYGQNIGDALANFLPLLSLLVIQIVFFLILCPILIYFAKKEQQLELAKKEDFNLMAASQLITLDQARGNINGDVDHAQANLYQKFYEESKSPLPLIPILVVVFNFLVNEVLLLMRSTPAQTSPIFPDIGLCTGWDYYILLILFAFDLSIALFTLFFFRKQELLKDQVKFMTAERYYTPVKRFWIIYACGFGTGFAAGLMGMAAGLVMITTMVEFGLPARVAGSTANFCYFLITCTLLSGLEVSGKLDVGEQFVFFFIGAVSVLAFTNTGYILMNRRNIGYILFYLDFALVVLNIFGNIAWGIEQGERFGLDSLVSSQSTCTLNTYLASS